MSFFGRYYDTSLKMDVFQLWKFQDIWTWMLDDLRI